MPTPTQRQEFEAIWDKAIDAGKSPWDACMDVAEYVLRTRSARS